MGAVKKRSPLIAVGHCVYLNCMDLEMTKQPGTYALILRCRHPQNIRVGKLGSVFLPGGYWIYVGSAFGPGGLRSRLNHHLKPSPRPHWHLDYIKTVMQPVEIWATPDTVKREHAWADALASLRGASRPVTGFGATDCACLSHLIHSIERPRFSTFARRIRKTIASHARIFHFTSLKIATAEEDKLES